ncbi:hypothetical protein F5887DRAFT_257027 [Amanita rubescens]|nr:hypothetical protein F5887DRAFT_257027 [Amanita rubescens]
MPWPAYVLRQFANVRPASASQVDFRGPYDTLLHSLFRVPANTSDFLVAPRWPRLGLSSPESVDLMFLYEVLYDSNKPVLVLQVKALRDLRYRSMREASDLEIRTHMRNLSRYQRNGNSTLFLHDGPR